MYNECQFQLFTLSTKIQTVHIQIDEQVFLLFNVFAFDSEFNLSWKRLFFRAVLFLR